MSTEVSRFFEETYAGRNVQWSGKLYRVDRYYSDLVFKGDPGIKASFEIHDLDGGGFGGRMVQAVVQLPEQAAEELQAASGKAFSISGELVACDSFLRQIYLARGSATPEE